MSFVYLISNDTSNRKFEKNDVGILNKEGSNQGKYLVKILRTNNEILVNSDDILAFDIDKTGDLFDFKICDRCFKRLSTEDEFSNNRHKKGDLITKRPSCKSCRKIKDGHGIPAALKLSWEKNRPKDFTTFTCPICSKTTIVGISKVVLDHDHSTGKVRGWLCESCNTGIGRFDDDVGIVSKAIDWLNKKI